MRNWRRKIKWSEISVEIIRLIAKHLKDNPKDLTNFRSVCEKWRRATAISALLPYYMGSETLFSSSIFLFRSPDSTPPWIVTIVEITKGKLQFCHPLTGEVFSNIPEIFNFRRFNPRRLNLDYHMSDIKEKCNLSRALFYHDKVLLFFDDQCFPSMVDDGSLLVLFRGGQLGGSPPVKPEYQFGTELPWFDISYGSLDKFDEILCFDGVVYALDRVGKLYQICTNQFAVLKPVVRKPIVKPDCVNKGWRKRLVGSNSSGKLYLIRRSYDMIKVYELCKVADKKLWSWVKVESFGDDDDDHKVLFISRSYSFFVSGAEFPGFKDCIIFSYDAFRPYANQAESKFAGKEIQIFQLGDNHNGDGKFRPLSSFPGFPMEVFSPPSWVLQAQTSAFPSDSQSDPEEDEMMEPCPTNQEAGASAEEHVSAPSCTSKPEEQSTEIPSTSAVMHKKAPDTAQNKTSMECDSNTQFYEGLDIKSNLLPTLQIAWNKHGNLVGDKTVRSRDMLVCALESLAKMIKMLQSTTARTLTDSLANDLDSIMFDLQCAGLKVDWLVPFVDRALAIRKNKPLIESIMAIEEEKAQADEEEREFLMQSAKKKQELEEKRVSVSSNLPFSEPFDLDQCLGEGLF
ncbi:hypothetical protein RDABS01_018974 [Bienertia sinuspersici]